MFKKSTNKNLKHINNREQYTRSHKEKFHAIISKPKLQSVANVIKYIYPEIGNPNKHINPHEMKIFKSRMNAEKTLNPDINNYDSISYASFLGKKKDHIESELEEHHKPNKPEGVTKNKLFKSVVKAVNFIDRSKKSRSLCIDELQVYSCYYPDFNINKVTEVYNFKENFDDNISLSYQSQFSNSI